ncbi:Temptin [Mizuhopecten yessoensis]|uniref:Temptin n=1 Tax=Mizuhopecten yessoensis TaxID=6573 RepID=A0A210PRQ6_MIZYE|nr:Temptin [Mizuhopecten yessoensis]
MLNSLMMKRMVFFLLILGVSFAFKNYKKLIPNGKSVPNPCKNGTKWLGVGHSSAVGSGSLNSFGKDFQEEQYKWTDALCKKDSDLDGKSNGVELGDPNCTWTRKGKIPGKATGHPGVCEPVDSSLCSLVDPDFSC